MNRCGPQAPSQRTWIICRHRAPLAKLNSGLQNHQKRKKRNWRRVGETDKREITDWMRERGKERLEGKDDGEEMRELQRGDPERRRRRAWEGGGGKEKATFLLLSNLCSRGEAQTHGPEIESHALLTKPARRPYHCLTLNRLLGECIDKPRLGKHCHNILKHQILS